MRIIYNTWKERKSNVNQMKRYKNFFMIDIFVLNFMFLLMNLIFILKVILEWKKEKKQEYMMIMLFKTGIDYKKHT